MLGAWLPLLSGSGSRGLSRVLGQLAGSSSTPLADRNGRTVDAPPLPYSGTLPASLRQSFPGLLFYSYAPPPPSDSGIVVVPTGTDGGIVFDNMVGASTGSTVTGTAAATFDAMLATSTGAPGESGTAATTFDAMTGASSGAHGVAGTAAQAFGAMVAAAVGSEVAGGSATTFGAMLGASAGAVGAGGAAAATLGAMVAAAVGSEVVGGSAVTFGAMTCSATGHASGGVTTGVAAAQFGVMTCSASAYARGPVFLDVELEVEVAVELEASCIVGFDCDTLLEADEANTKVLQYTDTVVILSEKDLDAYL